MPKSIWDDGRAPISLDNEETNDDPKLAWYNSPLAGGMHWQTRGGESKYEGKRFNELPENFLHWVKDTYAVSHNRPDYAEAIDRFFEGLKEILPGSYDRFQVPFVNEGNRISGVTIGACAKSWLEWTQRARYCNMYPIFKEAVRRKMETYQHCGVHRNVGASLDDYAFRDHLNLKEGSSEDGENSEMEDFIASDGHVSYEDDISAPAQTEQGAGSNDHDNTSVKDVFNGYEDGGQTACGEASYDGQNVFHSSSEPFKPKRLRRNRVASQADKQSSVASGRGKLGLSVDSSDDDDHGSGYNSFTTPKRRLRPSKSSFSAERMAENKALDTAEEVNADYQPAGGNDHQPQTPGRYHLRTRTNKQPESAKRTFLRTPFKRRIESSDSDNQESSARPQTSRRMKVAPKRVESAGRDPRPGDSPKDPNGTESEDTWDTKPLLRRPGCSSGRLSLVEIASSSRPRLRSYSQVGPAGNHTASTESSSKEKMTYNKKLKRGIPREWLWR